MFVLVCPHQFGSLGLDLVVYGRKSLNRIKISGDKFRTERKKPDQLPLARPLACVTERLREAMNPPRLGPVNSDFFCHQDKRPLLSEGRSFRVTRLTAGHQHEATGQT